MTMNDTKQTSRPESGTEDDTHITRTQHGDTEAFNLLVTKYQSQIESLILGQVHNPETAKDLTQETWIKAYQALPHFRGDSAFYTWLYQIAQNVCTDFFRRQQTLAKTFSPKEVDDTLHSTDTHPCPSKPLVQKELQAILRTAQQHLPPMRKKVFTLRYQEELPIKAIAKRLGKSEGTIKTHISKAKSQLRELLRPYLQNKPLPWY